MTYHSILIYRHRLRVDARVKDDNEFRIEEFELFFSRYACRSIIWILTQEKENK
jgi:hypothetical protein